MAIDPNSTSAEIERDDLPSVALLESALWKGLLEARDAQEMARAWLPLQCQFIKGAKLAVVVLEGAKPNSFAPAAHWPDENPARLPRLLEVAEIAMREKRGVARTAAAGSGAEATGETRIAAPIIFADEVKGAVALTLGGRAQDDQRLAMRQLQWGMNWLVDLMGRRLLEEQGALLRRSRTALDLVATALDHEGFEKAALAVVTQLAVRMRCVRVSLGVRRGRTSVVKVISHSAQFGRHMNLIALLGAAMDEALDQRSMILHPAPADHLIATSAHADLSIAQKGGQVLTIPLLVTDEFAGALTFERAPGEDFEPGAIALLEAATAILAPVLMEKRANDRWLIVKTGESLARQLARIFGPGHLVRKLVLAGAIAGAAFLTLAENTYRVSATAQIEGQVRRAIVAPYDGFTKEAMARAGDTVAEGDLLATLEDRELLLERLKWVTERQQRMFEYDKALAARQPAAINVIRSQIDQAQAQIKLLDEQLTRVQLRAPIAGLLVSGDLSQMIGAAVQRGQVLFEISPLDSYRVILDVDERDVGVIEAGQAGQLLVSALPHEPMAFVIDKVTPIAETRAGLNVFRVEGMVQESTTRLRPGMEGVGKIEIGTRKQAWIWFHPLLDWLRIWSWRWMG